MDSSPVLRNQSQNKIHSGLLRMKNEHIKIIGDPKPFKLQSAPPLSKKDAENQDPENSEITRKAPVRPGVSRLPVLAKSIHLQTPSDFSQSHCRWEEKPLAGKAKQKKPCTRPVPFNLSQPNSSKKASENQQPLSVIQLQTSTHAVQPGNNICNSSRKTQHMNAKTSKHPAVLISNAGSKKGTIKSHRKATDIPIHVSGQSGPSHTFRTLTTLSNPLSSISNNMVHENTVPPSSQPALSAEAFLANTNQVSVKDTTKNSNTTQIPELTTQGGFSKGSAGENFQPDHAALLSILCNNGISATGQGSATPQSKPYNYLPQRVSIMKSRQKAGHTTGLVKSVQFSPDTAALKSILHSEGEKAAGPLGATPRNSVCPSGRGTSIMTAQRVPVRKNPAEPIGGAVAVKGTPLKEWTPQRVRNTRHQPMSSMKWHLLTQPSPCASASGLRCYKTNLEPSQEREVVQRLFDDQEDEQRTNVTDKDPEAQAEQLPAQASSTTAHCDENIEMSRANISKDEESEYEQRIVGVQPFFQAPQRDSVIFFSTGKKTFRAPRFEKQESISHQDQHGAASPEERKVLLVPEKMSSAAEPISQIKASVQSLHRDVILQKSCALSPAVALLRKRLPPLEELRMDEEVATYTSATIPASPEFFPPQPRCGNPMATILLFEESTTFVPIGFDLSSAHSSPPSSPLQER